MCRMFSLNLYLLLIYRLSVIITRIVPHMQGEGEGRRGTYFKLHAFQDR